MTREELVDRKVARRERSTTMKYEAAIRKAACACCYVCGLRIPRTRPKDVVRCTLCDRAYAKRQPDPE